MRQIFVILIILAVPFLGGAQTVDFKVSHTCYGDATTLISTATVRDSIVKYLWDFNGDGSFYDWPEGDTVTYTFPYPGFVNVGHKIVTLNGLSKAIYKQIAIGGIAADFSVSNACFGQPVSFRNRSTEYADTAAFFSWDFGDGTPVSNEENPVHLYSFAGMYNVSLYVVTKGGCSDSLVKSITLESPPVVSFIFSGDTIFPEGDSLTVRVQGSFDSVYWSTGARTQSITVYNAGYYWVQVYRGACSVIRGFNVETREYGDEPEVASLITPNGDGFNDLWEILNLAKVGPCEASVYNKRGERVFSSSDYRNDWNGTYKGGPLSNDTYYYSVRCLNGKLIRGTLNILK